MPSIGIFSITLLAASSLFSLYSSSSPTENPESNEYTYAESSTISEATTEVSPKTQEKAPPSLTKEEVAPTSKVVDQEFCRKRYSSYPDFERGCLLYEGKPLLVIDTSKNIQDQVSKSTGGELLIFEGNKKKSNSIPVEISKTLEIKSGQGVLPGDPSQFIDISASPKLQTAILFAAIEIKNINDNVFIAA